MHNIDCAVIGAGVVGLAIARELALAGREVLILEAEQAFGTHTSSRNSEVIHAGISYGATSLKARLCVQGKQALYRYCEERGIGHARVGKLIVASTPEDLTGLQGYLQRAEGAGVHDLRRVEQAELREMEPEVQALAAVYSPSTGIIDSHGLMLTMLGDAENAGATLVTASPVLGGAITPDGIVLRVGGDEQTELLCKTVINSAGLWATCVAQSLENFPVSKVPAIHYARGRYYTLSGPSPFRHLVYPVTREATLRVHVTLDLAKQARFGPDLEWVDSVDYHFGQEREALFYAGIRRYFPGLPDGALQPGYTGIRPRLAGPDAPLHSGAEDFRIEDERSHGVPGLINLFGIESPGLTSSLAIGEYVRTLLGER
ncbi:NAD(P)/FAD-dependent oxidoreductase [Bordetella sp. 15P40C-2]|uniref:NAD(P)/FAD-dependent oxidoreductase n=1 Tax=Bordetella sp. 15P40C-2 TaxID=2572246 RepID=UPI00132C56D3|nr:NAD(P)/FAD-dependent oxidoreductase [Bordetella sp. 15P40C-2]MVW72833.1 FAD-dependent oxidoreductase [Bordetella sp. 15P40C-2]